MKKSSHANVAWVVIIAILGLGISLFFNTQGTAYLGDFYNISNSGTTKYQPDITYNPTTETALVAWSQTDGLVKASILYSDGTAGSQVTLDTTSDYSSLVQIAANPVNNYWIVVWQETLTAGGSAIKACRVDNNTTKTTPAKTCWTIKTGLEEYLSPDIGFDTREGKFVLVWEDNKGWLGAHRIMGILMTIGGTSGSEFVVADATLIDSTWKRAPAIPKHGSDLFVAWEHHRSSTDVRIQGRSINILGLTNPQFGSILEITNSSGHQNKINERVDVAADLHVWGNYSPVKYQSLNYMIIWHHKYNETDWDVLGNLCSSTGCNSSFGVATSGTLLEYNPTVTYLNGVSFTLAYSTVAVGNWDGDWNVFVRYFSPTTGVSSSEEQISFSTNADGSAAITSLWNSNQASWITWDQESYRLDARAHMWIAPLTATPTPTKTSTITPTTTGTPISFTLTPTKTATSPAPFTLTPTQTTTPPAPFTITPTQTSAPSTPFTLTLTQTAGVTTTPTKTITPSPGVIQTPVNDDFDNALNLNTLELPYSEVLNVSNATKASDDPVLDCAGNQKIQSVWYRYTPAFNQTIRIDSTGSTYEATFALWSGNRGALISEGCTWNDPFSINLVGGKTYYIEVVNWDAPVAGSTQMLYLYISNVTPTATATPTRTSTPVLTSTSTSTPTAIPALTHTRTPTPTKTSTSSGPQPEMRLAWESNWNDEIPSGSVSTSETNGTHFGSLTGGASTVTHVFRVWNDGNATLRFDGAPLATVTGAHAADFSVNTHGLTYSVGGGGNSTQFEITFKPTATGWRTAVISIPNNDPDEDPYTFTVSGLGPSVGIFASNAAHDGFIIESSENSGKGGTVSAGSATIAIGDDATRRQQRGFLSFDTSQLPDNAVVVSVQLNIQKQGLVGTSPWVTHKPLLFDLKTRYFGSSVGLAASDFQSSANYSGGTFGSTLVNGWYTATLKPGTYSYINKAGWTQVRLRFKVDDDNDAVADILKVYSGNATKSADRPQLIVQYYIP